MISHPQKAIFVHIPKTAGRAIERVFLCHLGLSLDERAALYLRFKRNHESGPPNVCHLLAGQYTEFGYVNSEQFNEYYKFSFVRNPWARAVSMYRYMGSEKYDTFEAYVENDIARPESEGIAYFVMPQYDYLYDKQGKLLVDFVGRHESLQEDFNIVANRLGMQKIKLPVVNQSWLPTELENRGSAGDPYYYRKYYNKKTRHTVGEIYQKDIDTFGYSY